MEHIGTISDDFGLVEMTGYNSHFGLVEVEVEVEVEADYDGRDCDLEEVDFDGGHCDLEEVEMDYSHYNLVKVEVGDSYDLPPWSLHFP